MIRFNKKKLGVTKAFALKASLYRRLARKSGFSSTAFTKDDLLELFQQETYGIGERTFDQMKKTNGFAYGKWLRDIDTAGYIEGIMSGDFAKIEFLGTALERIHNQKVMDSIPSRPWFPYEKARET